MLVPCQQHNPVLLQNLGLFQANSLIFGLRLCISGQMQFSRGLKRRVRRSHACKVWRGRRNSSDSNTRVSLESLASKNTYSTLDRKNKLLSTNQTTNHPMLPAIDFISSVDIPQLFVLHKTWPVSSVQWMMSSEHFVANYYICDQLLLLWSVELHF